MNTQKGFVPILIVILVATAALLGGYLVYQKSTNKPTNSPEPSPLSTKAPAKVEDPTANWKIYTDPDFNFTFKYPESIFKYSVGKLKTVDTLDFVLLTKPEEINSDLILHINASKNSPEVEKVLRKNFDGVSVSDLEKEILNIDGVSGYYFYHNPISPQGLPEIPAVFSYNLFFKRGGILYQIGHGSQIEENYLKERKELFNQIISTLKFLNQNQTATISNWKTYDNRKHKYTIKYPPNWLLFTFYPENKLSRENYNDFHLKFSKSNHITESDYYNSIEIKILKNEKNLSALDYVTQVRIPANAHNFEDLNHTQIPPYANPKSVRFRKLDLASGIDAIIVYGLNNIGAGYGNSGPEIFIANGSNNEIIHIIGRIYDSDDRIELVENVEDILNQILSTFKFTQ